MIVLLLCSSLSFLEIMLTKKKPQPPKVQLYLKAQQEVEDEESSDCRQLSDKKGSFSSHEQKVSDSAEFKVQPKEEVKVKKEEPV